MPMQAALGAKREGTDNNEALVHVTLSDIPAENKVQMKRIKG